MPVAKPTTLPRWSRTTGGADFNLNVVAPPSALQDSGWASNSKLAAQIFNWLFQTIQKWIEWLNDLTNQTLVWTAAHTFQAGIALNAQKILNVADPTLATDAATKNYVDQNSAATILPFGSGANPATSPFYLLPGGCPPGATPPGGTVELQSVVPVAGKLSNLRIARTGGSATNASASHTYTVRINGISTSIVATMASGGSTANDTTHTANVAAGDLVSIQVSAASMSAPITACIELTKT